MSWTSPNGLHISKRFMLKPHTRWSSPELHMVNQQLLKGFIFSTRVCYPEILRKWRFTGIGKNVSASAFSMLLWPIMQVCETPKRRSRGEALRYWRPENIVLGFSIPGNYSKIKQIAASKCTMVNCWTVENFFYFKNGLFYPNKKGKTISFLCFLKANKLVLLSLENYVQ